jgi:hypothetical protein
MKHRVIGYCAAALAAAFLLAQGAYAQDPAPGQQDLVGARGSSGEQALEERGYPRRREDGSAEFPRVEG